MSKARRKKRASVTTKPLPWNGDHGAGGQAANQGTVIVPVKDSPNRMARRQRVEVIDTIDLTVRQKQAAIEIRNAYCRSEALSSGGPLKEWVQASPKPDATVAVQVGVISAFTHIMRGVLPVDRAVIEHVCFHNRSLRTFYKHPRQNARFKQALDRVADHLRY